MASCSRAQVYVILRNRNGLPGGDEIPIGLLDAGDDVDNANFEIDVRGVHLLLADPKLGAVGRSVSRPRRIGCEIPSRSRELISGLNELNGFVVVVRELSKSRLSDVPQFGQVLPQGEVVDEASVRQLAAAALQNRAGGCVGGLQERRPTKRRIEEAAGRLHVRFSSRAIGSLDVDFQIVLERHLDGIVEREIALRDAHTYARRRGRHPGKSAFPAAFAPAPLKRTHRERL